MLKYENRLDLKAADISKQTQQIFTSGSMLRRKMIHYRPYICPFEELITRVPKGSTILDVGCGDGLFLNILAQLQWVSSGLGIDRNKIALATAREANKNILHACELDFKQYSIDKEWPSGKFDVVTMIDVLHHLPPDEKQHAIEEAVRHVKPGGLFLFKDMGISPRWRRSFNSLHDFVLSGELVTYTHLNVVASWVESMGAIEVERKTTNRFWYGHETIVFSKMS